MRAPSTSRGAWRRMLTVLLAACLVLSVALRPALAQDVEWSFERYGELVGTGEAAFDAANYNEAVERYREAHALLEAALRAGQIPADATAQASVELTLLEYKLAVALQRDAQCEAALEAFEHLAASPEVPEVLAPALPVRIAEAGACAVAAHLDQQDVAAAEATLERVDASLQAHPIGSPSGDLAEEASAAEATLQAQRERITQAVVQESVDEARAATAAGRCAEAEEHIARVEAHAPTDPVIATLRGELDAQCGLTVHDWAPWVVTGVGGVLLITGLALESSFDSDVDDFHDARDECRSGNIAACDEALELADDLEARQPVPTVLMVTGTLAIGGGVAWWLLTHVFEIGGDAPGDALAPTPTFGVGAHGAHVGVGWDFEL